MCLWGLDHCGVSEVINGMGTGLGNCQHIAYERALLFPVETKSLHWRVGGWDTLAVCKRPLDGKRLTREFSCSESAFRVSVRVEITQIWANKVEGRPSVSLGTPKVLSRRMWSHSSPCPVKRTAH